MDLITNITFKMPALVTIHWCLNRKSLPINHADLTRFESACEGKSDIIALCHLGHNCCKCIDL